MSRKKSFEEALEDNPLRPLVRDFMEILPLARAAEAGRIGTALQVACARGDSTEQLLRRFDIRELVAVDKSAEMIGLARQRHAGLAELHNYAEWREGLAEMARVLKPGGLLVMNELSIESFERGAGPYFKRRTVHPYERMFCASELRTALGERGLEPRHFRWKNPLGFLPYLIIVARKRS
jgi:SAM-dependent methyltransferase